MKKKICFKCKKEKNLVQFYKHKQMADGYLNKCKDCTKSDILKNRSDNIEYYREYDRNRADLPKRIKLRKVIAKKWKEDPKLRKRANKQKKEWIERNQIKRAAHVIVGNALKSKKIIKQACEVCGIKKVDAHHDDYLEPLNVRWLCKKHHAEHHTNKRNIKREEKLND